VNKKVDAYIKEVLRKIQAPIEKKQRIEADLQAHFHEAEAAGEQVEDIISRMGTPSELAEEMMSQVKLVYASFFSRLAALLLDALILGVVTGLYLLFLIVLGAVTIIKPENCATAPDMIWNTHNLLITIWAVLAGIAVFGAALLYFPISEARFGKTWGKQVMKLSVVKENGLSIGYKEAILRRLSFFFNIYWLDALFVFFTEKRQRAFDIIAKTVVIKEQ
jgi:uncharacterized RDD family membrane protein YckC